MTHRATMSPTPPSASNLLAAHGFLRLSQIVGPSGLLPIGRSTWWAGVRTGRFPPAVKIGPRITAWRREDIEALIERIAAASH